MTKMLYRLIALSFIFLTFVFPIGQPVIAEDGSEENDFCENCHEKISYEHQVIRPHMEYYFELLLDKYSPDLKEEWTEVLRERESILKKLKQMKKEGKLKEHPSPSERWYEKHGQIHDQFLNAVKKRDDETITQLLPQLLSLQKEWNVIHKEF
ncbi:hypothetical protein LGQ02_07725 [Bacillus shivajii]|uniref:hypothetical protein n=1 Tax=Bacillus shivajii TaxID=1983719 RepID=UPI001CFAEC4C|nr:hypothetical protein [Bacillus shivajii]UCZ54630.1 hypothetical protein LGQ02_07725 [Bacillus shivajii]